MKSFLAENDFAYYSEDVGSAFVDYRIGHDEPTEVKNMLLYPPSDWIPSWIEKPPTVFVREETIRLPDDLGMLLGNYRADCESKGLKDSTIRINLQQTRRFLHHVSICDCARAD